jgi:hypothetical protein
MEPEISLPARRARFERGVLDERPPLASEQGLACSAPAGPERRSYTSSLTGEVSGSALEGADVHVAQHISRSPQIGDKSHFSSLWSTLAARAERAARRPLWSVSEHLAMPLECPSRQ